MHLALSRARRTQCIGLVLPPVGKTDAVQVSSGRIAIPDADALVLQLLGIGAARDKPEQLLSHPCTAPSIASVCSDQSLAKNELHNDRACNEHVL